MKNLKPQTRRTARSRSKEESGIALIIAIIGLLLLTAVAAGMVLYSNGEVNVDANYRDQQVALFAAKAGLQEARDRMLSSCTSPCVPLQLPTALPGSTGGVLYITASSVTPWATDNMAIAPSGTVALKDTELTSELTAAGLTLGSGWYTSYSSLSTYSGSSSNPIPYQWVRINLKTDGMGAYSVDNNSSNNGKQVLYDTTNLHECVSTATACPPSPNPNPYQYQPVYEITSFAVTANGTQRMVQDEVTAINYGLNFGSALTMPGTVGSFQAGNSANYGINGIDGSGSAPSVAGCSTSSSNTFTAIGLTNSGNIATVDAGIPSKDDSNYPGNCGSTPCVGTTTLPTGVSTPSQWTGTTLPSLQQNANVCLVPNSSSASATSCANPVVEAPGSGSNYSWSQITAQMPGGSWTNQTDNPQIIYVDGNVDISAQTGSGILVVTGNLTYDGNSGWNGIILVVGDGTTTYNVNGGGSGQFNGALFVASLNGNSNNWGTADFNIKGGGGSGIFYNSCWIKDAQQPPVYKLLSSKEISF